MKAPQVRINNQIRAKELRVITEAGENLGTIPLAEALARSLALGVDLIEISPNALPPVAKLMDFGKWQYLNNKKQKLSRGRTTTTETKGIQVTIGTGDHDLEIKASKATEFLNAGHRVRIDLFLRGRAKYLDQNFLKERLERLLKFVAIEYKISDSIKKSNKGLSIIIERKWKPINHLAKEFALPRRVNY